MPDDAAATRWVPSAEEATEDQPSCRTLVNIQALPPLVETQSGASEPGLTAATKCTPSAAEATDTQGWLGEAVENQVIPEFVEL